VPNVAADTLPLEMYPVFLYFQNHFQRPNPFRPDVAIDISPVFSQKIHAMDAHTSQFYEWLPWIGGYLDEGPADPGQREQWLAEKRKDRITRQVRASLRSEE